MTTKKLTELTLDNIIILDGCIDLIVDFNQQIIGFSGMRKTDFHFKIKLPADYLGFRLMPGVFHQLTNRAPQQAMDQFLPLIDVFPEFDSDYFFSLTAEDAKHELITYLSQKLSREEPAAYVTLFNELIQQPPATVTELCKFLGISQSQCQRNFQKYYGLTPKAVLSILRFQKTLTLVTSKRSSKIDLLLVAEYYDQSHLINDFKRNIGITPLELLRKYPDD